MGAETNSFPPLLMSNCLLIEVWLCVFFLFCEVKL